MTQLWLIIRSRGCKSLLIRRSNFYDRRYSFRHGQYIAADTSSNTPLAKLYINLPQKCGSGSGTITELSESERQVTGYQ